MGGIKPFIFDVSALVTQAAPQTKVIALLNPRDAIRTEALLATNLNGCVFRHEIDKTLIHAIRAVAQGGTWFSRSVMEHLLAHPSGIQPLKPLEAVIASKRLTRRDQQILACLLRGDDNAQIGTELRLADQTVRNYVNQVCKKLGVPRDQLGKFVQTMP